MERFFTEIWRIFGTGIVHKTTYHPQLNEKVEKYTRKILSAIRRYVGDYHRIWDQFTSAQIYEYNTQVHSTIKIELFTLVLSRIPPNLALGFKPELEDNTSTKDFHVVWLSGIRSLMDTALKYMGSTIQAFAKIVIQKRIMTCSKQDGVHRRHTTQASFKIQMSSERAQFHQ